MGSYYRGKSMQDLEEIVGLLKTQLKAKPDDDVVVSQDEEGNGYSAGFELGIEKIEGGKQIVVLYPSGPSVDPDFAE